MSAEKLAVFSVRTKGPNGAAVWIRVGSAYRNRDGSITVALDVLPLDGKLHLREPNETEGGDHG